MKFLAFACLIAVAYAYPSRLGEEKCTYGPSYWCDNYKQAVECKAVEHCRNYVWKPKGADQCDQCKAAITKLNTFVATNSSKVLEIMNNVCAGLGSSAPECKLAVQMYGEQIIAALKEITSDGEKLCKELELCTSVGNVKIIKEILVRKLKSHPYIVRLKSAKADYCNDCKLVFGEIKTVLEDDDLQKEIVAAVEDLCEEFGSFATQCKSYVDTYLPLILDELASLDDPTEICDELGLCNSTVKAVTSVLKHSPPQAQADQCDECKAAVAKLHTLIEANSSKLIEIMNNLCAELPQSAAAKCKMVVKEYGAQIVAFLGEATADGEKVCKELELCSSTDNVKIIKEILLSKLKRHPYIRALKSVKADYCEDCKLVFGEIKDLLQNQDMQKEIIQAAEALCDEFGSFAAQCKTYVDTYLPLVLEELASLDDPTEICDELGLCNTTMKTLTSAVQHSVAQPEDQCDECKAAVAKLNAYVKANPSKVIEILTNLCGGIPVVAEQCKSAVQKNKKEVIAFLSNVTANGERLCKDLELCSSTDNVKIIKEILLTKLKSHPYIRALKSVKADYCEECKLVFGEIKDLLQDKDMQKEIISAVEALCDEFGSFAAQCKTYVDTYLPLVLEELASLDDPTTICDELGLCNATDKAVGIMSALEHLQPLAESVLVPIMPGPVILTPPKNVESDEDKCEECEATMKLVNYYATNNATDLKEVMKEMCATLGSKATLCNLAVGIYGKKIIQTIKNVTAHPKKLCTELGMCPSNSKEEFIKNVFVANLKTHPSIQNRLTSKDNFCDECKLVFAEVKDILEDKSMQEGLTTLLESLCADLGSFADQCKTYVEAYLPLILEALASMDDPSKVCTELGLCNATSKAVDRFEMALLRPALKKVEAPTGSAECIICEFVMKELDSILGDKATREEIEAALDKVCSLLPSTIRSECDTFVNKYADEIITLLLEEITPDQICTKLGLCSSNGKPSKFTFSKPNDETCDLCKMAVQYLESILESNATEEEIKKALEDICNMLPASLKTECNAIVAEYGDLIIKIILGEITPDEVCELLKLCQASKKLHLKDGCILGESYWCISVENARKCNALKHCNYIH